MLSKKRKIYHEMKKKFWIIIGFVIFGINLSVHAQKIDLVRYVNTLQGTNSSFELTRGNTYPTTALPFAMHTWTPQTGINGDGWKYQYQKDSIRGFQQAHQCSSWTNDYAVFSLMPVTGKLQVDQYSRAKNLVTKTKQDVPIITGWFQIMGLRLKFRRLKEGHIFDFHFRKGKVRLLFWTVTPA